MFSHLMLGTNNLEESKKFYDATLGALGYAEGKIDGDRCFYSGEGTVLAITKPVNGEPATFGNGMTLGLKVNSPEEVEAWFAAGVANGGQACENPPGIRDMGSRKMYLAYLRDPCGNKLCATHYL